MVRRILTGLLVVVTLIAAASPAAAVPGLVVVFAFGPETGSEDFKIAGVKCPPGKQVLGGGAAIGTREHGVKLSGIDLTPGGVPKDGNWSAGYEDAGGYDGDWTVGAWAFCASGITGRQVVQAEATATTLTRATAVASCPAGKQVIGVGGRSTGKTRQVLDSIWIAPDRSGVSVEVYAVDGAVPWAFAQAVCADPVPGSVLVSADSAYSSLDKSVSADCPAGTSLHSLAGGVTGAAGAATMYRLAPHGPNLTGGADLIARETLAGTPGTWQANIQLICAP